MAHEENKRGGGNPICVAFVGINFAEQYVSFEGRKRSPTDGEIERERSL
jgi:hypothetical protein